MRAGLAFTRSTRAALEQFHYACGSILSIPKSILSRRTGVGQFLSSSFRGCPIVGYKSLARQKNYSAAIGLLGKYAMLGVLPMRR